MDPYHLPPFLFSPETLTFDPYYRERIISSLDLLAFEPTPFELFHTVTDLIQLDKTPCLSSYRRTHHRILPESSYLLSLSDRISALESKFDRLISSRRIAATDRKYTLTTEIKGVDTHRKYKFIAAIEGAREEQQEKHRDHHGRHHSHNHHKNKEGKSYKWTADLKNKGEEVPVTWTYTWKASNRDAYESSDSGSEKKEKKDKKDKKHNEKKCKKGRSFTRMVEIEEPTDHGSVVLRQAFSKRAGALRAAKGKNKELSPQDAALLIQMSFKAYLVRRSRALCALKELAMAKARLKEIRSLFNNFSYRRRIARDTEERQRFSEKIIVLLLTVDAIEGADLMVRGSKKSILDELEAMLDVVDPQPPGKLLSIKRRTFDMPDGVIQKEMADDVTQIRRMLKRVLGEEEDQTSSEV
ncbi:hypothetical protein SAY87_017456 [Trapa incisa]|uniref:BAG family molecular chaperone regulator 7 n=1 Tax=Trapa incisa TaxID=236973 RepID=A0AAN7L4D5_9MYRT|nr:hypothetical protein SAY87_017456 [Trapa incisa]